MNQIQYSEISNYIGRTLIFEQKTTGLQRRIHLTKIKNDIILGTGVVGKTKIYYELPININHTISNIYLT